MDFWSLIQEIMDITEDTILNKKQRRRFIETTIMDYLSKLDYEDLPQLKAEIGVSRNSHDLEDQ